MVFDSALTINAANGRSLHANLRNAAAADGRSTVAKSVKRMLGYTTDIGVSLRRMRRDNTAPAGRFFQCFGSSSDGVKFETAVVLMRLLQALMIA